MVEFDLTEGFRGLGPLDASKYCEVRVSSGSPPNKSILR